MASSVTSVRGKFETIRSLGFAGIGASYAPIGASTASASNNQYALINPSQALLIKNTTNADLTFSLDGVNDHFILSAGESFIFDVASDKTQMAGNLAISSGTIFYVKGTVASGSVYVSSVYAAL